MKLKNYQKRMLAMLLVLLMVCCTAGMAANAQSQEVAEPEPTEVVQDLAALTEEGQTKTAQTEAELDLQANVNEEPRETVQKEEPVNNQGDLDEDSNNKASNNDVVDQIPTYTYDQQPTKMEEVQETIDNYELTGIKPKWEMEVDIEIIPEGWRCDFVTDDELGLSYWTLFQNIALFSAPSKCTITEKYVTEDGNTIPGRSDTKEGVPRNNDYSKVIPEINGYIIIGYRVGSLKANLSEGDTAQIKKVNNDTIVYFIYRKLSTTISVTYPSSGGMDFYVSEETYPYVKSDGEGKSGYYTFTNKSDFPLKVTFGGMTVEDSAGLEFISDAASSAQGSNHISLSLVTPSGIAGNGFTNGVASITRNSSATVLGTLKGKYVSGQAAAASGYITIGGYYAGYLNERARNLKLTFKFTFALVTK